MDDGAGRSLADHLTRRGFRVTHTALGQDALDRAVHLSVDLGVRPGQVVLPESEVEERSALIQGIAQDAQAANRDLSDSELEQISLCVFDVAEAEFARLLGRPFEQVGQMDREDWGRAFGPFDADGRPIATDSLPLGQALRQIALLIKSDVGLEVAFAESGGWDTHVQQGTTTGSRATSASGVRFRRAASSGRGPSGRGGRGRCR